jgi:predicted RND superfamily exporter protein
MSGTEVEVEEAPEVEDNSTTVVIETPVDDSGSAEVTNVDLDHEQRLTRVEMVVQALTPVVERVAQIVEYMDERITMTNERVTETQEAVAETQEVIVETAEATPTKADDEVVEDEIPTDATHRWWRGRKTS